MIFSELLASSSFVILAIAHSLLGERAILGPLFAASWSIGAVPRWAAEHLLRVAWHLTSVAWLGLGAAVLGAPVLIVVGVVGLASAAMMAAMLRGHFAWPIFLVGGLAAFHAESPLPGVTLRAGAVAAATVLLAAAVLHGYWAAGGRRSLSRALPVDPAVEHRFAPGRVLTAIVAVALAVAAGLTVLVGFGVGPGVARWLLVGAAAVFALRAVGDSRLVGFSKTERTTEFARDDDRWFTPLCVLIALGMTAALIA